MGATLPIRTPMASSVKRRLVNMRDDTFEDRAWRVRVGPNGPTLGPRSESERPILESGSESFGPRSESESECSGSERRRFGGARVRMGPSRLRDPSLKGSEWSGSVRLGPNRSERARAGGVNSRHGGGRGGGGRRRRDRFRIAQPWYSMEFNGIIWNSMDSYGIQRVPMEFNGVQWNSIEPYGTSCQGGLSYSDAIPGPTSLRARASGFERSERAWTRSTVQRRSAAYGTVTDQMEKLGRTSTDGKLGRAAR
eukprot:gene16703-biopygen9781